MAQRIIIVEDEPEFLYSLDLFLKKAGYLTIAARDGAEALARILRKNAGQLDLMLLDLDLPRIDGAGVLAEMKLRNIRIPVIIVSGTLDLEKYVALMRHGCREIFFKPINPGVLLQRISDILSRSSGTQEYGGTAAP